MGQTRALLRQKSLWCVLSVNLFEDLPPKDLEELSRHTKNYRYRRGETIYFPGDPASTVYFLKRGRVKLVYLDESGRKLTLAICRPGQPFGELDLEDRAQHQHRLMAQALTDAELCLISKGALLEFASRRPHLSLRLTKWVDRQLREAQVRLEELLFKDVPTRLARVLLRLSEEHGIETPEGQLIDLPLTHQELAELIGATRETTSLTLSRFAKEGWIRRRRQRYLLLQPEALRRRAGE